MDDRKKNNRSDEKKSVADQMTDMLATAAGALAETAVKTVAKRVRKTVTKKTPAPVKNSENRSESGQRFEGVG